MGSYDRKMMTPKELLIQELDDTPEPVIVEVLNL